MNIEHIELERVREVNLPEYLTNEGLNLRRNNQGGFITQCPFHEDKTPSLNVNLKGKNWLWHCFGCGAGGDVIKYVILKEKISFNEAVEKLIGPESVSHKKDNKHAPLLGHEPVSAIPEELPGSSVPARLIKIISQTADYYHETLKENKEAGEYLKKRGLLNPDLITKYRIGFCDGSLPKNGGIWPELEESGIINRNRQEHFHNCIVFPIEDGEGNIVSMYGRHIYQRRHLYLPGSHRGLFNWQYSKGKSRVYLTESIIDALSLIEMGLPETVALYGTNGFTADHDRLMSDPALREIYFCFDNDEAGRRAVAIHSQRLSDKGLKLIKVASLNGTKDVNEFLLAGKGKAEFLGKTEEIIPKPDLFRSPPTNGIPKHNRFTVKEEDNEIYFKRENLSYRIRHLNLSRVGILKVSIKIENREGYHLDTFDLYSARSRQNFTKQVKKIMELEEGIVSTDLKEIVDWLELYQAKLLEKGPQEEAPLMTEEERKQAFEYLKNPILIEKLLEDAHNCSFVGEEKNFLLGYLVSISRKLKNPLALFVISQSGAGKTELQDQILSFSPPEDVIKLTRLTDQSLFYQDKNALTHKLIAIEEEEGASGAGYSIRHLISAQGLTTMTTVKDEATGKMKAEHHEVKGPISMMITTTNPEINYETYNRFLVVTVDESQKQTKEILKIQRHSETLEGIVSKRKHEAIKKRHQNMQRLLEPLEIVNPYAEKLSFTDSLLRARREQKKYHHLIKAVCLLRQHQKKVKIAHDGKETFKYIEVERKDIEVANHLAKDFLIRGLDEMNPQSRKLINILWEWLGDIAAKDTKDIGDIEVTLRQIREHTKWSDYQLRKQVAELVRLEYLIASCNGNGKRPVYKLVWDGKNVDRCDLGLSDLNHV